jgi:hypothetical protein
MPPPSIDKIRYFAIGHLRRTDIGWSDDIEDWNQVDGTAGQNSFDSSS